MTIANVPPFIRFFPGIRSSWTGALQAAECARLADMRRRSVGAARWLALIVLLWALGSLPAGADPSGDDDGVAPQQVLLLGPLPGPPVPAAAPPLHGRVEWVPEVCPGGAFPLAGQEVTLGSGRPLTWHQEASDRQGAVMLPGGGVHWLAARLHLDRWAQVEIEVAARGSLTLFLDGQERGSREGRQTAEDKTGPKSEQQDLKLGQTERPRSGGEEDPLVVTTSMARGAHAVLLRVELPPGLKAMFPCRLTAAVDHPAGVHWSVDQRTAPADFDRTRQIAGIGSLAVAVKGRHVARRLTRHDPTGDGSRSSVEVFDGQGNLIASEVGGGSARPVAFSPDGGRLLLARSDDEGTDLLLWTVPAGPARLLVRKEPGLGLVRFSPDGKLLLLASSRGVEVEESAEAAVQRRRHLRERVPDYTPLSHLHLVDLGSGVRRRLTSPGDHVLDDAVFLPDGQAVIYGVTVPRPERPWFHTEIRRVDLITGSDQLVTTFVAGWEVRPQSFAVAPDGQRLAFLGPPEEVGAGRADHNVYNKQVWLLDLMGGTCERITHGLPFAFDAGGNLPAWDRRGVTLLTLVDHGARRRLARLMPTKENGWTVETLSHAGATVGSAVLSSDSQFIAFTVSGPASLPELRLRDVDRGGDMPLERPNAEILDRWLLSSPEDASFTGPGGETIEAWWYPSAVQVDAEEVPLVLYYYGGSSPTSRAFNPTHQFFAANGYAVLVVNPRGAFGYGDAFADHHAGDWGPTASADILAGVDAFLAAHPEVDGERIGIYGGSYGGFLTQYLITATDRFAAAVSLYGISDLATYWGQGDWGWTYGDMALAGATPWADPEEFVRKSPLYRADRIRTPLLLLHGLTDGNVTPGESEEMFTALSIQDKPVELVLFPGEAHGIAGSFPNRVAARTMILEWFDRYLRDQPAAWEARWE